MSILKKAISKYRPTIHIWCPMPMTIDMSAKWKSEGNVQEFPNGCFVQINSEGEVSHGVQPYKGNPVGWEKVSDNTYVKTQPIMYEVITDLVVKVKTADNVGDNFMTHDNPTQDGYMVYNTILNEEEEFVANPNDKWFMSKVEFIEKYTI